MEHKGKSLVYIAVVCLVATLGGLLFGYDTAVISGAIGFMTEKFTLSPDAKGWAASSALIGCIIGAAFAGVLSDRFGRKKIMILSAIAFFGSALWAALAPTIAMFNIARILGGLGIGAASMLSPLYIAEISPANIRGRLVSLNQFAIVFGMLVVYFVNAKIASPVNQQWNIDFGWRYMFGSGVIPAAIFWVLLYFVPESPRWLVKQGKEKEALDILTKVGGQSHALQELAEIKGAIVQEEGTIAELFQPGMRVALIIGIGLAVFQQITGINVILYYAPEIFKSAGLASSQAINDTVIIGVVNIIFTIIAVWIVDKIGRKPLLIIGTIGMGLSLAAIGPVFKYNPQSKLVLVFILSYVAFFAVAMGPLVWVLISEIFPTRTRGRAMSIATVMLWISCYLVSQTFPRLLDTFKGNVFWIYSFICIAAVIFIAISVPETKGKTLEEIEKFWHNKAAGK